MQIELEVIEGPSQGSRYEFDGYQAFVLGRAAKGASDFRIPTDPYFSRYHMLFEFAGGHCVLRDMDSRNGVFVNDQRIQEATLSDGDLIRAGRSVLRVHVVQHDDPLWPAHAPPPCEGDRLGRYKLLGCIAEGAQGSIFEATGGADGGRVALKVLHPHAGTGTKAKQYFEREVEILAALRHPRIVPLIESGREGPRLWLAMDLIEGPNLEELVDLEGPLDPGLARRFAVQVLEALLYAHAKRVIHRDLKPVNLLVQRREEVADILIADFGLARPSQELGLQPLTATGEMRGTPQFMPPEQVMNAKHAGPASDLYGLGATLYWALTKAWHIEGNPDSGNVWQLILGGQRVPVTERVPDLPQDLAHVIETCLAKEARNRFQSAAAALRALGLDDPDGEAVTRG